MRCKDFARKTDIEEWLVVLYAGITSRAIEVQFGLCDECIAQHAVPDLTANINPREGG